jgi:hypothetical protein
MVVDTKSSALCTGPLYTSILCLVTNCVLYLLTLQITTYTREGLNRLSLSAYDSRNFCVGVRIIRRNSLRQVGVVYILLHWQLLFS